MDPFAALVRTLDRHNVRFVVIGVWAANYYARASRFVFHTEDRDLFLPSEPDNLVRCWDACGDAGWEIWNLQSGGLTPHETLRVATIYGAEALGLQKDVGSIDKGKLADLLVLDRNPLTEIHNTLSIKYVMKNGELYEADTLDRIWPTPKKLEKQYWWNGAPASRSSVEK
jgi:hypothetical protein